MVIVNRPITACEAAKLLRCVSVEWLRAEAEAGRLPHLNADGEILFDLQAVRDALLARARQMPPQTGGEQ